MSGRLTKKGADLFYTSEQLESFVNFIDNAEKHGYTPRLIPCEPRDVIKNDKQIREEKAPAYNIVKKSSKNDISSDKWQPKLESDKDKKKPQYFSKESIIEYIEQGYKISIVPSSIGCCAIDIDVPDKTDDVINLLGQPLAIIQSKQEGRVHLYYKNSDELSKKVVEGTGEIFSSTAYLHIHHPEDFPLDFFDGLAFANEVDPFILTNKSKQKKTQDKFSYASMYSVLDALSCIDPDESYDTWIRVGMALHSSGIEFSVWNKWSAQGDKYEGEEKTQYKWDSFLDNKEKNISLKSLFKIAIDAGWDYQELVLTQDFIAEQFLEETKTTDNDQDNYSFIYLEESDTIYKYNPDNGHWIEYSNIFNAIRQYIKYITTAETPGIKRTFQTYNATTSVVNIIKKITVTPLTWLDKINWLVGCPSGVYDLKQNKLRIAHPREYITKSIKEDPLLLPNTPEPELFNNLLGFITKNNEETIEFVWKYIAYSLTGYTHEQTALFIYGKSGSGKSTFTRVLLHLFDTYATTTNVETLLDNKYSSPHRQTLARLFDKRLVEASEPKPNSVWRSSELNNLISGEQVEANFMRQNSFVFTPKAKYIVSANHAPRFSSTEDGLVRRLATIHCDKGLSENEQDEFLLNKILNRELLQIASKIIKYLAIWKKEGLKIPESIKITKKEYIDDQDLIQPWIDECCLEQKDNNDRYGQTSELFMCYANWCRKTGEKAVTKKTFGKLLSDKGFGDKKKRIGPKIVRIKTGVSLNEYGQKIFAGTDWAS